MSGSQSERPELLRSEEELHIDRESEVYATVGVRKTVENTHVEHVEPRSSERADLERLDAEDGDSGEIETLPDGSVSIPVFEQRLVISKETYVRERVIVRKRTVVEHERIEADLRKERIAVEGDVDPE